MDRKTRPCVCMCLWVEHEKVMEMHENVRLNNRIKSLICVNSCWNECPQNEQMCKHVTISSVWIKIQNPQNDQCMSFSGFIWLNNIPSMVGNSRHGPTAKPLAIVYFWSLCQHYYIFFKNINESWTFQIPLFFLLRIFANLQIVWHFAYAKRFMWKCVLVYI